MQLTPDTPNPHGCVKIGNREVLLSGSVIVYGSEVIQIPYDTIIFEFKFIDVEGAETLAKFIGGSNKGPKFELVNFNSALGMGISLSAGSFDGRAVSWRFLVHTLSGQPTKPLRALNYVLLYDQEKAA